jgi:hypothetical protein
MRSALSNEGGEWSKLPRETRQQRVQASGFESRDANLEYRTFPGSSGEPATLIRELRPNQAPRMSR